MNRLRCKYCAEPASWWFNLAEEVEWGDEIIDGLGACEEHAEAFREAYEGIIVSQNNVPGILAKCYINFPPEEYKIIEELERRKEAKEGPCDHCDGTGGSSFSKEKEFLACG